MSLRTVKNTVYLYPMADIQRALETTTQPYTFDGTNIVCANMTILENLYADVFAATAQSQPVGNVGFSLGVGTFLEDFRQTIYWKLSGGATVIRWQLVKQLTPQTSDQIPVPGNSPPDTVGYVTVFTAFTPQLHPVFDAPFIVRSG
jgi:hypothetical protein